MHRSSTLSEVPPASIPPPRTWRPLTQNDVEEWKRNDWEAILEPQGIMIYGNYPFKTKADKPRRGGE
jgi:hypothetical protein